MTKPAEVSPGGLWYGWRMDYLDFRLWKLGVLLALVAVWGLYCGFTGRSLSGERHEEPPAE